MDELIGLDVPEYLLVALDQLVNIRFIELHHVLFAALKIEGDHLKDQWILLVAQDANDVFNAIDRLPCLAQQGELSQVVMGGEPRGAQVHPKVQRHEIVEQTRSVFYLRLDILKQLADLHRIVSHDLDDQF